MALNFKIDPSYSNGVMRIDNINSNKLKLEGEISDKFITEWVVPAGNFTFPAGNTGTYNAEIDFGDGGGWKTITAYNDADLTNTYASGGTYQIKVRGTFPHFYINNGAVKTYITKVIQWGNVNKTTMAQAFYGASNLTSVPDGAITDVQTISGSNDFVYAFANTGLTVIPDGFLDNCISATGMAYMFRNSPITNIPDGLFDNITTLTVLLGTFSYTDITTIPSGLFDNNTSLSDIRSLFAYTDITTIPSGLFDVIDENVTGIFSASIFDHCYSLASIPSGLFDGFVNATSFGSLFNNCQSLTSLPVDVFRYTTNIADISGIFSGCTGLDENDFDGILDYMPNITNAADAFRLTGMTTIPDGLLDSQVNLIYATRMFYNNTQLVSIPSTLFNNCINLEIVQSTFAVCPNLSSIGNGLFDNCTQVNTFAGSFQGCTSLSTIPSGLFDNCPLVTSLSYTFSGCALTSIPANLFDNNTLVTTFQRTFFACSLTAIPAGLFDNCTLVENFDRTFQGNDITAIPTGLFDNNTVVTTFAGCLADNDFTSIPAGLFDNCPLVTDFSAAFWTCTSLTAIPAGLFDNNPLVTTFFWAFFSCYALAGDAPTLWIDFITADGTSCFLNSSGLTNYNEIPSDWGGGASYTSQEFVYEVNVGAETLTVPAGNTGVYNAEVSFDDGGSWLTVSTYNDANLTHTYSTSGTYKVRIRGTFPWFYANNGVYAPKITKVVQWGDVGFESMIAAFYGASNLIDLPNSEITGVSASLTNASYIFASTGITSVNIDIFKKFVNVTDYSYAFNGCSSLTGNAPLYSYSTGATLFTRTHEDCILLTTLPDLMFNGLSSALDFQYCFNNCPSITSGVPDFTTCISATNFAFCFDGDNNMTGSSRSLWLEGNNTLVPPNYDVGTPNGLNCYRNATGLTDYATIPIYWK